MRSVFDSEVEDEDDAEGHAIVIVGVRLRCKPMRVGEACRRIPIAQPPITAMRETVDCCTAHGYRNAPQLTNANGITVGDIVDRAITLARLYVNCPEAEIDQHDPVSGEVKVGVTFQARLKIVGQSAI